jgi:hypothetical protein
MRLKSLLLALGAPIVVVPRILQVEVNLLQILCSVDHASGVFGVGLSLGAMDGLVGDKSVSTTM